MEEKLDRIIKLLEIIYKDNHESCPGFYRKDDNTCTLFCEYKDVCMRDTYEYFQNQT